MAIEAGMALVSGLSGCQVREPSINGDGDAGLMLRWATDSGAVEVMIDQHGHATGHQFGPEGRGRQTKPRPCAS